MCVCVCAGVSHNARSVAQVALVDEWGRPVFNVFVKQAQPVASYITELTGLSKDTLEQYGMPMGEQALLVWSVVVILITHSSLHCMARSQPRPWRTCERTCLHPPCWWARASCGTCSGCSWPREW